MPKWLFYSHLPTRQFFRTLSSAYSSTSIAFPQTAPSSHYVPQTKHVPHTSSPELLSLVSIDNFYFNFLNTFCPALTQLSGSTQPTNHGKSNAIKHIILFLWVSFSGHLQDQSIPFWETAFSKKEWTCGPSQSLRKEKKRLSLPSTLHGWMLIYGTEETEEKAQAWEKRLQGSVGGRNGNERDWWGFPTVGLSLDGLGEHCIFSIAGTTFSRKTELSNTARTFALQSKSDMGEKFLQDKALTSSEPVLT